MRRIRLILALIAAALFCAVPARAQVSGTAATISADETAIRALIDKWYVEHRAGPDGRPDRLKAPGSIDPTPGYLYPATRSAAAGPRSYNSLAYTALEFRHEISQLKIDPRFARASVYERGYFFAWAAQRTSERLGSATFVLEKQDDGRWLVLAHQTYTMGIPPNLKTDPMPDLRALYYSTVGKDRDPEADALAAGRF